MKTVGLFIAFPLLLGLWGCSSLSLPSLPWSSATQSDPTAEALYAEGVRNFKDKRYVRAIDNFSKIRSDYPFSPVLTEVELKIADAYYLNEQYPEAINAFKEFQTMHPTNEQDPFVTLRLGQAYFKQVTTTDRDQKNTEIAKSYFESVVTKYPKSPQAAQAREKLAKCLEYLAEHDFNVAYFYYQQQKYPAARDRLEEIVRKYKDTPTAVKSLFYLGESYRHEKNAVRAALAYEALIEHYPQSQLASDARSQLAQVEKEKHDPLALLLMRDRRPTAAPAPEVKPDPALAKLRDLKLVAKTEVVHENPGDEKSFLRRVADTLNPFSSSDDGDKDKSEPESAVKLLAKRYEAQKKDKSEGVLSSLWPFGSSDSNKAKRASVDPKTSQLVQQIDQSLAQKGIDPEAKQAALKPPAADLPNTEDLAKTTPPTDTKALLSSIDKNLQKQGMNGTELPPEPEAAAGFFKKVAAAQAAAAEAKAKKASQAPQDVQSSGILSSIDAKLQTKGFDPGKFEKGSSSEEVKPAESQSRQEAKPVEIEPKVTLEKGPLFLKPADVPAEDKTTTPVNKPAEGPRENERPTPVNRILVKGPVQPQSSTQPTQPAETQTSSNSGDESKGGFDQLRQDVESVSKVLNPFSW